MPDEPKTQEPAEAGADPKPEAEATAETEATPEPETTGLETQIEMDEVGPCKRVLKVEVPVEKVLEEIEKSFRELGSTLTYPGFRKGRVPRLILEKRFGTQIRDEVKETLLQTSFEEAVTEKKLSPLGEPEFDKVEFETEKPFSYEVTLDVRPEFELGEYKGIQVDEPSVEPTPEAVEGAIDSLRRSRAELVTVEEGVAQEGDYLIADIGLFVGEEKVHLEEETSIPVGGDQAFGLQDPKIRDLFVGAKVGEPAQVEIPFPEDFPKEEQRGQTARITLDPKEVKRLKLPELDKDLAKELGHDSVKAVREDIVEKLRMRGEMEKLPRIENAIIEKILASMDLPLPEDIIEKEADNVEARQRWRLEQMGLGEEQIAEYARERRSKSKEEIARSLREIFVLDKIADAEKIFVTEDDVDRHLAGRAAQYGKTLPALKEELRETGDLGAIRMEMRHVKVREYLREHAEITPAAKEEPAPKAAPAKKATPAKKAPAGKKPAAKKAAKRGGRTPKGKKA